MLYLIHPLLHAQNKAAPATYCLNVECSFPGGNTLIEQTTLKNGKPLYYASVSGSNYLSMDYQVSGTTGQAPYNVLFNNRYVYLNLSGLSASYRLQGEPLSGNETIQQTGWYLIAGAQKPFFNPSTSTTFPTTGWQYTGTATTGCTPAVTVGEVTPSLSVSATPGTAVSAGNSITLTATPVNGGLAPAYVWMRNNSPISGATSSTYASATLTAGDVISCELHSNSPCVSTSIATRNQLTLTGTDPCAPFVPQNITVSDAGAASGVYTPDGILNGAPKWTNGNYSFVWTGSAWYITSGMSTVGINTTGSIRNLPCTGWQAGNVNGIGIPTVTGGCGPITGPPSVAITATPGITIASGSSLSLTASGATSYICSNGVQSSSVVLTNVTSATTLSVTGTTGQCSATASAAISVTCDPAIMAHAASFTQTAVLSPDNCSVQLTGSGFGTGYTITGSDGYVFSSVYRKPGCMLSTG